MSFPSASSGLMASHCAPRVQVPLPQQPGSSSHDVSQSNPQDAYFNNHRHPELFNNNANPFPMYPFGVSRGSVNHPPSHPFLLDDRPLSDGVWPGAIPPPLDSSSYQYTSTSQQNPQATRTRRTLSAHPTTTARPVQFVGSAAPAGQDAAAPSSSSLSWTDPTAPRGARPLVPVQPPDVIDAGSIGWALPTTVNAAGYARPLRRVAAPAGNPHVPREVPLVRVEDRIEWVRRDLLKMTLWFNWSPDAEAEAHDPWGELPHHVGSSADGGAVPIGTAPAPDAPLLLPRSVYL